MFSEDLLIRSQKDSMANIISFLLEPNSFTAERGFSLNPMQAEIAPTFRLNKRQWDQPKDLGETEAGDNQLKEARLEDYIRTQQARQRRQNVNVGVLKVAPTTEAIIFQQQT